MMSVVIDLSLSSNRAVITRPECDPRERELREHLRPESTRVYSYRHYERGLSRNLEFQQSPIILIGISTGSTRLASGMLAMTTTI